MRYVFRVCCALLHCFLHCVKRVCVCMMLLCACFMIVLSLFLYVPCGCIVLVLKYCDVCYWFGCIICVLCVSCYVVIA